MTKATEAQYTAGYIAYHDAVEKWHITHYAAAPLWVISKRISHDKLVVLENSPVMEHWEFRDEKKASEFLRHKIIEEVVDAVVMSRLLDAP